MIVNACYALRLWLRVVSRFVAPRGGRYQRGSLCGVGLTRRVIRETPTSASERPEAHNEAPSALGPSG